MVILPFLCILNNRVELFCQIVSKTTLALPEKPLHQNSRSRSPAKQALNINHHLRDAAAPDRTYNRRGSGQLAHHLRSYCMLEACVHGAARRGIISRRFQPRPQKYSAVLRSFRPASFRDPPTSLIRPSRRRCRASARLEKWPGRSEWF